MKKMNREMMNREIHGMLPDGNLVYCGSVEMDYEQVEDFLYRFESFFIAGKGTFRVNSCVYNCKDFIGVKITPLCV